jgi:hypothetical protein
VTTRQVIKDRADSVNRRLAAAGSDRSIDASRRNGHWCIDEYRGEQCISLLAVGSGPETADLLRAMLVYADLERTHT